LIVAVASGKGGTGKTSVAVNLAVSLDSVQLLDCDVEEPNAYLLLHPEQKKQEPVYVTIPKIDEAKCTHCGSCAKVCQYGAILALKQQILLFPELCHSCGGCMLFCPEDAITEEKNRIGSLNFGYSNNIALVYGELEIGKPMPVPIIKAVKQQISKHKNVIIDSPPGTSCSFVETVRGSDFCVLVSEPTPFGLYDLQIAVEVLRRIKVTFGVVVNRAGVGDRKVYDYCTKEGIPILLEIPYDRRIAEFYSRGVPFSLEMPGWKEKFQVLFSKIEEIEPQ
jgi:MinD superfamily P-loop ATPase